MVIQEVSWLPFEVSDLLSIYTVGWCRLGSFRIRLQVPPSLSYSTSIRILSGLLLSVLSTDDPKVSLPFSSHRRCGSPEGTYSLFRISAHCPIGYLHS